MKVYQLKAEGTLKMFDGPGTCRSKRLFAFRSQAIAYEPQFRVKCTTEMEGFDICCLEDNKYLHFSVVEYELNWWDALRAMVGV